MRNNLRDYCVMLVCFAAAVAAGNARAEAIPIFAMRYHLECRACHSVLPELNAFGLSFRARGYQLPLQRHGTTAVALRYQMEYEQSPGSSRRFTPGGVLLSNADIGTISAFVHYNLGAGGGPSGLFIGYIATFNEHTQTLYRAGLFELPLAQSPGQRLDDLAQYGYYGTHVGLNDLPLSSPRWGVQAERTAGLATVDVVADLGEFKGAAYGGAPVPTGETTSAASPEIGIFATAPVARGVTAGVQALVGTRRIVLSGRSGFSDPYTRAGLLLHAGLRKLDLSAEQWFGHDANADGFGSSVGSSGGYFRIKYYPTPHSYLGVRYDASANPSILRDVVYYGAFLVTPHARLVVQQVQTIGGTGHFGGAVTVGFPWPPKL
ncbi:MAG: hypothetical protein M3N13_00165 [Candidatus Eremiobacteraeota bacterium]|nr:hypothetical protein [Candidatus Eremiobacteraeota bacterium]